MFLRILRILILQFNNKFVSYETADFKKKRA